MNIGRSKNEIRKYERSRLNFYFDGVRQTLKDSKYKIT